MSADLAYSILFKIVSFLNNHFSIDMSSRLLHLASFSHVFLVNGTDRTRKVLLLHFMLKVLFTPYQYFLPCDLAPLDTSRGMKSYEVDGRDYFFVSRQTMENFIQKKKFIEFGEYRGYLYGTSKDSIKRAMKSGKTCVVKVQPEVWKSFVVHSLDGYKCHHLLYCLVLPRGGGYSLIWAM